MTKDSDDKQSSIKMVKTEQELEQKRAQANKNL